jgi:hypothetical protein
LLDYFESELNFYTQHPDQAVELLAVGSYPQEPGLDVERQAALMLTIGLIYNLDEAVVL